MPYDPQTAGAAEVSVRNLKGQVRAMHLTLDRFMEKHVPVTHPLIAWLVEHAAFVRLTGVIGQDGMSAYHRIRGTEHKLRLPFFGKKVRYKCRSQEGGVSGAGRDGAMEYLWAFIDVPTSMSCLMPCAGSRRQGRSCGTPMS